MNVLILTQFYPPEPCAASNRTAAVAHALREAGHSVHVLTGFPNFPSGRIPVRYRGRFRVCENDDGVRVTRLWTFASRVRSSRNRLLNWASVAIATLIYQIRLAEVDVVYVTSPPITLALPAAAAKFRHRAPVIVDIRDSYPEVAVRMGMWPAKSGLTKAVGRVARWLYGLADAILCVTHSVREEVVARGADPEKVFVAPNGFDAVEPARTHPFARADGTFVAAFVGNIGLAAGVDVILDAAQRNRTNQRVQFVVVGDGSECARLAGRAARDGLKNVHFLGALPREAAMAVLRDADVCVVPLRANITDSLPTKMFDALSVECPLLVAADGEARHFLERSNGGWAVEPENADALAAALASIALQPAERAARARSGREYVERHFRRDRNAQIVVRLIERAGERAGRAESSRAREGHQNAAVER